MAITQKSSRRLASASVRLFPDLPRMPASLIDSADGAQEWNAELQEFWESAKAILSSEFIDGQTRREKLQAEVTVGDTTLSAAIVAEQTARINGDTALATSITTLTATVNSNYTTLNAAITNEAAARASADTAEATTRSSADATLQTNINTVSASVVSEAAARASADGNLSGKYTLTVTAGDVVTGMNITSASGPGTNISSVTFNTDNLKVTNANGTVTPFDIRAGTKVVFGADIQSDNYSAGSAGWRLTRNGDFEGNTGTFRGTLSIFDGQDNEVLVDTSGVSLGDRASSRYIWM